jgi:hypothetical protein
MAITLWHILYRYRWLITFLLLILVLLTIAALVLGPLNSHGWIAGRRTLSF